MGKFPWTVRNAMEILMGRGYVIWLIELIRILSEPPDPPSRAMEPWA